VSKPLAVYVCGDNTGLSWDEPFIVMTDDGSHQCETGTCNNLSAWCVEMVGWNGDGEPPYLHPTRYACMAHVGNVMELLLPDDATSASGRSGGQS
jgi:hypothetical protein